MTNMYRGFIYSIEGHNALEGYASFIVGILGECEWDEFLNAGMECERCPDWCREGCFDDGSCPVPTHNPWP